MNSNYQNRIARSRDVIANAAFILIGAGAGLSTSDGLHYSGKRFQDNFPDFIERYGLTDMYSSAFYPFETREERWGYWSRHIKLNCYDYQPGSVYKNLLDLVKGHNYFVLTTNGDRLFFKSGFETEKIFPIQGDYSKFQCSRACHDTLYDNNEQVMKMVREQDDLRIPAELIPICPVCGEEMDSNLRIDRYFVQDKEWHRSAEKYQLFLSEIGDQGVVLLELGVGYNTPSIIKYPFENITSSAQKATLIRINKDYPEVNPANEERTIAFNKDIGQVLNDLLHA